jgi:hypothetical protein
VGVKLSGSAVSFEADRLWGVVRILSRANFRRSVTGSELKSRERKDALLDRQSFPRKQ